MPAAEAARQILDGVRRNYAEFSVPGYLLYLGHILRYINDFYKHNEAHKKLILTSNLIFLGFCQKKHLLCCEIC